MTTYFLVSIVLNSDRTLVSFDVDFNAAGIALNFLNMYLKVKKHTDPIDSKAM